MQRISMVILFIISCHSAVKAQLLDKPLKKYQPEIAHFLKKNGGMLDTLQSSADFNELIYSRQIQQFPLQKTTFYEIGLTVSHGYKYLGIIQNDKLQMLLARDFNLDFNKIISFLKTIKSTQKLNETATFLLELKDLYDYNSNPPWKERF